MLIENTGFIIGLIFGALGFIIAFFMSRSLNIIIFGGFTYAIFRALDALGFTTDWGLFNDFLRALSDLGRVLLVLMGGMLKHASDFALILFIFGGILGLVLRKRSV